MTQLNTKIRYNIRGTQIIDLIGKIKDGRLITSPFFQRNLVWRLMHKQDFIKTILLGYPFPEIFIAKGELNVEDMTSTSCIVDGQQRMNSIMEFVNDKFEVDGIYYKDLSSGEKENFLKYEVAIVDLDLKAKDSEIKEIFSRLNRTFYSLTTIEKMATEYASSELMLVAKLLTDEICFDNHNTDDESPLSYDPNITEEFITWAKKKNFCDFKQLIMESTIFSKYEISRKVHLQFVLNVIATLIDGMFNRNLRKDLFDELEDKFEQKDEIIDKLNLVAKLIINLNLDENSYWYNKANAFSILISFYNNYFEIKDLPLDRLSTELKDFEKNIPAEYAISAKEGVNNRKERNIRDNYLLGIINKIKMEKFF